MHSKVFKAIIFLMIILCLFMTIQSVLASNFYVNKNTAHENITKWIKNDAINGDTLIFKSNYNLKDTLVISKSINIRSHGNAKIYFNKSKNMFNITTNCVNFTKLTIIHKPLEKINYSFNDYNYYSISTIYASKSVKINIKNINIFSNNQMKVLYIPQKEKEEDFEYNSYDDYEKPFYEQLNYYGINIYKGYGNIVNSIIKINNGGGLEVNKWIGNIKNSTIITKNGRGINTQGWTGNIINSKIKSTGKEVYAIAIYGTLKGNIKKTKIIAIGVESEALFIQWSWEGNLINSQIISIGKGSSGIISRLWNGTVYKSNIHSKGQYSVTLYNWALWKIKIIKSKLISYGNESITIHTDGGICEIIKSKIYSYGYVSKYSWDIQSKIKLFESKGIISKSIIKQTDGYAICAPETVKIKNCKIITTKGLNKIYTLKPDLKIVKISKSKNTYIITIDNLGDLSTNPCYLSFQTKNTYKIAKIKKIEVNYDVGGNTPAIVKIKIPEKYANEKYIKTIKIDIYNQNKEINEKNNIKRIKI